MLIKAYLSSRSTYRKASYVAVSWSFAMGMMETGLMRQLVTFFQKSKSVPMA
jgi:hypothetical protein